MKTRSLSIDHVLGILENSEEAPVGASLNITLELGVGARLVCLQDQEWHFSDHVLVVLRSNISEPHKKGVYMPKEE